MTGFDAEELQSEGVSLDRYARVEEPDAVLWADAVELSRP